MKLRAGSDSVVIGLRLAAGLNARIVELADYDGLTVGEWVRRELFISARRMRACRMRDGGVFKDFKQFARCDSDGDNVGRRRKAKFVLIVWSSSLAKMVEG